jgi:hypothetical protein
MQMGHLYDFRLTPLTYSILRSLRCGARPMQYVMALHGASEAVINELLHRHLVIPFDDHGDKVLRLSWAGIAYISALESFDSSSPAKEKRKPKSATGKGFQLTRSKALR